MLGQVTNLRLGNQKLISVDSIALFGIIGLLAAIGAIMTHNFESNESSYLNSFVPVNIPILSFWYNETCYEFPEDQCYPSYQLNVVVNCTAGTPVCGNPRAADGSVFIDYDYGDDSTSWNDTINTFIIPLQMTHHTKIFPGFMSSKDNTDFRFFATAVCDKWCDDTTWMYHLCVAIAGLCVGFSGLVFLYLYLGCILDRINPRRRLERLARLLLMQGEEAPKLERVNTASKSESIRPDLREY